MGVAALRAAAAGAPTARRAPIDTLRTPLLIRALGVSPVERGGDAGGAPLPPPSAAPPRASASEEGGEAAVGRSDKGSATSEEDAARARADARARNLSLSSEYKAKKLELGAPPQRPVDRFFASVPDAIVGAARFLVVDGPKKFAAALWRAMVLVATDPRAAWQHVLAGWGHAKEVGKHYWLGTKLLVLDVRTAYRLVRRLLAGHALTRRERKQLLRTVGDLLRIVPFAAFILIPFMEVLLPVALRLFPNMLPSTFQESHAREEKMKRQLRARLDMAAFLQDTVREMAANTLERGNEKNADELLGLIESVRQGRQLTTEQLLDAARIFKDEITLDNASRAQLVGMSAYMGLNTYGTEAFLRFQLRSKVRAIRLDDQAILWEGVESLSREELEAACQERGMRATGLSEHQLRWQLGQWLDLSVHKELPTTLLILSRAFNITAVGADTSAEKALVDSISSMEEEVVAEAVLGASGEDSLKSRQLKLESLKYQNELIEDEQLEREAAAKRDAAEREAAEAAAAEAAIALEGDAEALAGLAAKADVAAAAAVPPAAVDAADERKAAATDVLDSVSAPVSEEAVHAAAEASRSALEKLEKEPTAASDALAGEAAAEADYKLTSEELDALAMMTSDSALAAEREMLRAVRAREEMSEVTELLARGRIGVAFDASKAQVAAAPVDAAARVRAGLDRMLTSLEHELESVDETIGSKLYLLDRDKDGVITTTELQYAIQNVLGAHNTPEEAARLAALLDTDGDGTVTVDDILEYAKEVRRDAAKQALQDDDDHDSDGAPRAKPSSSTCERDGAGGKGSGPAGAAAP